MTSACLQFVILATALSDFSSAAEPKQMQVESALLQDLVQSKLAGARNLTDSQKQLVTRLKEILLNQTVPEIDRRHQTDTQLITSHVDSVNRCDTQLASSVNDSNSMWNAFLASKAKHNACNSQLLKITAKTDAEKLALESFLSSSSPPVQASPPSQYGVVLESWLLTRLTWFQDFDRRYTEFKANISALENEISLKTAECNGILGNTTGGSSLLELRQPVTKPPGVSEQYCTYIKFGSAVKRVYATCRNETQVLVNKTVSTALSNAEGRKADYGAQMRLQCYIAVLEADDITQAAAQVQHCESTAVNTSHLSIATPVLPPLAVGRLAELDKPRESFNCSKDSPAPSPPDSLY